MLDNTDIKVQQITKIDCSILYLAILEFLYIKDAPKKVIINESILLAKKFSSNDSFKFINKILDKIGGKSKKMIKDEDALLKYIKKTIKTESNKIKKSIGDDCAVVKLSKQRYFVITTYLSFGTTFY